MIATEAPNDQLWSVQFSVHALKNQTELTFQSPCTQSSNEIQKAAIF
jgi:hypothetical protein